MTKWTLFTCVSCEVHVTRQDWEGEEESLTAILSTQTKVEQGWDGLVGSDAVPSRAVRYPPKLGVFAGGSDSLLKDSGLDGP